MTLNDILAMAGGYGKKIRALDDLNNNGPLMAATDYLTARHLIGEQDDEGRLNNSISRYERVSSPEYGQKLYDQELSNRKAELELKKLRTPQGRWSEELGGWVYDPDEKNPNGRFVQAQGVQQKTKAPFTVPSGYEYDPSINGLRAIKGGPADPEAVEAKKPPTEDNNKSYGFALRMLNSDNLLRANSKYSPFGVNTLRTYESLPSPGFGIGNAALRGMLSEETLKADQAQRDFINAILRRESGAVISDQEFDNANKQYFNQPNDPESVKRQKALNRKLAIEGLRASAGNLGKKLPAYEEMAALPPANAKGWPLLVDANGNQAYVGPNGEIEEVQ